jgi:oligopeptide transport system ATP-binding protein
MTAASTTPSFAGHATPARAEVGGDLLRIEQVSKVFDAPRSLFGRPGRAVHAVDTVSFALAPGETLGLVGETGSGKSTLGRLVLGLLRPSAGHIAFEGRDIANASAAAMRGLRQRMQMVFQDPYGSLDPRMSVASLVAEPLSVHRVPRAEREPRVHAALRQVGLDPTLAHRYPHEFSGGQRQRIGIARAMVLGPSLLVLDEPVSALDVSIQAQILNLLREIQAQSRVAYLFIAHDLAVVRHISDRVAVMYLGRIVEIGPRDAIYRDPQHPYTVSLLSAVPIPDPRLERERVRVPLIGEIGSATDVACGCRFHPRCPRARALGERPGIETTRVGGASIPIVCVSQDPMLTPTGAGQSCACHFPGLPDLPERATVDSGYES